MDGRSGPPGGRRVGAAARTWKPRSIWSTITAAGEPATSPTSAAGTAGSPRKGLHDAVRRRYKVIVDSPEVIIADLSDSETHWNAN